jgi:hypothetical protein
MIVLGKSVMVWIASKHTKASESWVKKACYRLHLP